MTLQVQFYASRHEVDVDGFFLANKSSATLGTAVARSKTDLHISGNKSATDAFLTTKPLEITMKLPDSCKAVAGGVEIPADLRMNVTTSRIALGIAGDVGTTLSGQASILLSELVEASQNNRSATADCMFASWSNISAYVQFDNAKFVDSGLGKVLKPEFVELEEDASAALQNSETILQSIYDKSSQLRSLVVYQPAPPLSKPVMKTPVGINASTYDLSCNVVDRPPSLSRDAFESLAKACMSMELKMQNEQIAKFVQQTKQPSILASTWAHHVANAMSTMVCFTIPYRLDGATTVMPSGLSMIQAEFWKAEPQRDVATHDDCEGSGTEITSLLYAALDVARNDELANKYPFTAAFANALCHHVVGLCVLAANAGSADAAGEHGHNNIAGHAIALAVPKASLMKAKVVAMISSGGYGNAVTPEQAELIKSVKMPFCKALYEDEDVSRMPEEEKAALHDPELLMNEFLKTNSHITTLAMEGTSPVQSTKIHEHDVKTRLHKVSVAKNEKELSAKIGPTIARTFSSLHLPPTNNGPEHAFYKDFVEFLLPARRSGTFQSAELRNVNQAACHYVFASSQNVLVGGVNMTKMFNDDFSIIPLYKLGVDDGSIIDAANAKALEHTMTRRRDTQTLNEREFNIYNENIKALRALATAKPAANVAGLTEVRQIVTIAAMTQNENSVKHLGKTLSASADVRAVKLTVVPIGSVLASPDGDDVGALVELRVFG
jgi:hypothetical protein